MSDKTGISWTDATWNPIRGCSRVSEGCRHCYAERQAARIVRMGASHAYGSLVRITDSGEPRWTGKVQLDARTLAVPLRWRKPRRIFVNSMSDLFHEALTNELIAAVFGVMAAAPQHTFQVLTKRAKRMREWFAWAAELSELRAIRRCGDYAEAAGVPIYVKRKRDGRSPWNDSHVAWPLPNVWLGVSVENQAAADERIPELLATPAAVRFLSCEPLIGPVEIKAGLGQYIDAKGNWRTGDGVTWVIAGCESGPGARPCDVAWLRSLRDQCGAAGVPFFLKQAQYTAEVGRPLERTLLAVHEGQGSKRKAGGVIELPYLDGVQHAAFPGDRRG